ncbi:MAG: hypothetical protein GF329_03970 [Candidatus Lokiarchaeota archaeon]|nr:hypothetical protein [Candidatus Lokiarchaeota archaeon]
MKKNKVILFLIMSTTIASMLFLTSSAQTTEWEFLENPIKLTNCWDHVYGVDMDTASDGSIHFIYKTNDTSNRETYYGNNEGNVYGNTTSTEIIDNDIYSNYEGSIAVDSSGNAHIVWRQHDGMTVRLYYTNNIGGSFMSPITVDSIPDGTPDIAIDNSGKVWIVYRNGSGVYVRSYTNSLSSAEKIPNTFGTEENPSIAANVYPHIVFDNGTGSEKEIYYSKRIGSFSPASNISDINPGGPTHFECLDPDIFVDSSEIPYIVYQYNWPDDVGSNTSEIFFSFNLQLPYYITWDEYNQTSPEIAVTSGGSVCVVYLTLYPPADYNEDVHLKIRNPGENFQNMFSNYTALTTNPYSDLDPRISVDSNDNIHVVWYGYDGAIWNVFYNRGLEPTTTPPIPAFTAPIILGTIVLLVWYKKYKK